MRVVVLFILFRSSLFFTNDGCSFLKGGWVAKLRGWVARSGGCSVRIRDVYPGSRFLTLPDPGSRIQKQQQKRGVKKNLLS
jgi:hypothetical protein